MHIESLSLTNFRCFGPVTTVIPMEQDFTAFVGDNGAGKTAVNSARRIGYRAVFGTAGTAKPSEERIIRASGVRIESKIAVGEVRSG